MAPNGGPRKGAPKDTVHHDVDGTRTVHPDGSEIDRYDNGAVQVFGADGNLQEWIDTDGTDLEIDATGNRVETRTDGTVTYTSPTEHSVTEDASGKVVGQGWADGTQLTNQPGEQTWSFPDGNTVSNYPDGSVQVVKPDGTSTLDSPDGTRSSAILSSDPQHPGVVFDRTDHPDGTTDITFPGGTLLERSPDGTATWNPQPAAPTSPSTPSGSADDDGSWYQGAATDTSGSASGSDDLIGDLGTPGAPAAAAATSTAPSDVGFVQGDTTASSDAAFGQVDGSESTFAGVGDVTADAATTGDTFTGAFGGGDDFGAVADTTDASSADDDPSSG